MQRQIRVGIVGYGQVGRGVEIALQQQPDMVLAAVFTRRDPDEIEPFYTNTVVKGYVELPTYQNRIDVIIVCGQSKSDLSDMSPYVARMFNMVDSYDVHPELNAHLESVENPAAGNGHTAIIGVGWDPGLFSMLRLLGEAVLPAGQTSTFWGEGLSQGHTAALKSIKGVVDAVQYTIPKQSILEAIRSGETIDMPASDRHERVCYVVVEHPGMEAQIKSEIQSMPHYFDQYDTTVHFIDEETLRADHSLKRHGGHVIRTGETIREHQHQLELIAKLDSNPEFTGSVLAAYARAAVYMELKGQTGAKTVYDVPLSYLTHRPMSDVIRDLL